MSNDLPLNRRFVTLGLTSLGAAFAIPRAAAQVAPALSWTPTALTPAQARTLDLVAELIIPATDTPGAREAGVPQFVDRAVANWCTPANAAAIRTGLDRIEAESMADYGVAFAALKTDQQNAMLAKFDDEREAPQTQVGRGDTETGLTNPTAPRARPFFPVLRDMVTTGYFTSHLGATQAVKWDPVPGPYLGCVPLAKIGRAWAL